MKKIEIIHEDSEILLVNKPSGISVTKDRAGLDDLIKVLKKQLPDDYTLLLVHRLDKGTSGIMLIAKTTDAQRKYSGYFAKRQIHKTYLALVSGVIVRQSGSVKTPLSHSKKDVHLMCIDPRRGKPAQTDWKVLADFGQAALIAANPVTGRTHQIRVHLKSIGLPLAIDPLYAGTRPILLSDFKSGYRTSKYRTENPLMDRMTLHAYQLTLPGIDDGTAERTFAAPLDKKFAATIKMLTKHNPNGPDAFEDITCFEAIIEGKGIDF